MIIDGIAASEHLDSSGEILKVSGHDISDLVEGKGVLNWEHNNDHSDDILGAITYAKKIMKKSDCANDREREYWDSVGTPFVYIKAELFDNEDHPGAVAAAAIIRYYHKRGLKILAGFSIEGSTLERTDNILERSVGRRVALTLRPCNKSAISGVLEDADAEAIKKYMNLDGPSNIMTADVDTMVFDDIVKSESDPLGELKDAITNLRKTLTAGGYNVAPSQLTGGSALQVEDKKRKINHGLSDQMKERLKRAVKEWDRKRPLREAVKAVMPELSDEYIDHFTEVAEDISLKKGQPALRIGSHHSWNKGMNAEQRRLVEGIYLDNVKPFKGHEKASKYVDNYKNDAGQLILLKPEVKYDDSDHSPAVASAAYYKLASDYFGMADHVPVTNHISHSRLPGQNTQVFERMDGVHTPYDMEWGETLKRGREDGTAHKMAIMDMILGGDSNRNYSNMLGKQGRIIHIDNDDSFRYDKHSQEYPDHFHDVVNPLAGKTEDGLGKDLLHIDAAHWLAGFDARDFIKHLGEAGINKDKAARAVKLLMVLQQEASGKTLFQIHDLLHPKTGKEGF